MGAALLVDALSYFRDVLDLFWKICHARFLNRIASRIQVVAMLRITFISFVNQVFLDVSQALLLNMNQKQHVNSGWFSLPASHNAAARQSFCNRLPLGG